MKDDRLTRVTAYPVALIWGTVYGAIAAGFVIFITHAFL